MPEVPNPRPERQRVNKKSGSLKVLRPLTPTLEELQSLRGMAEQYVLGRLGDQGLKELFTREGHNAYIQLREIVWVELVGTFVVALRESGFDRDIAFDAAKIRLRAIAALRDTGEPLPPLSAITPVRDEPAAVIPFRTQLSDNQLPPALDQEIDALSAHEGISPNFLRAYALSEYAMAFKNDDDALDGVDAARQAVKVFKKRTPIPDRFKGSAKEISGTMPLVAQFMRYMDTGKLPN